MTAAEHFTVVTCHQGLQFMPDKAELNAAVERHLGPTTDVRHSFGDASALARLLVDAGVKDVDTSTMTHDVQFADGALFARLNAMALVGMSDTGKAMSEAERGELAGQIAAERHHLIARGTKEGTFVLPLASILAVAHV